MALPEIPQARLRPGWLREHKRKLIAAGLAFFALLLFLSLVPLPDPDDQRPIAKVERAILSAVPRWGGSRMERSDPLAMITNPSDPPEAAAGRAGPARAHNAGYAVADRSFDVPSPPEDPVGLGDGPKESGARLTMSKESFAIAGFSQAQGGGAPASKGELSADAPFRPGSPSLFSRVASAARRLIARRSRISGAAPSASKPGGAAGAPTRTQEPDGASLTPPGGRGGKPAALTPVASVPEIGKAVVVVVGKGSSGFGGGGGGGGRAVALAGKQPKKEQHRCSKISAKQQSLTCFAAQCMLADIQGAYEPLLAVTMAYHGVAPPGVGGGVGADLIGGMVDKGIEGAQEFTSKAGVVMGRAAAYAFRCRDPQACDGLASCRDFVVDQLTRASVLMRESARAFESARQPCKVFPGTDSGVTMRCDTALGEAAGKDRIAAGKVKQALFTAAGQSARQCKTMEAAEQTRWDTFNNALVKDLRPVLALIEKPFCPDRLPCEPRGVGMLREAAEKLRELGHSVDALTAEVNGLPGGSGASFTAAASELTQAIPMIENHEDAQSRSLFGGISLVDRAVSRTAKSADAWGSLARGSCPAP